MYKTGRRALNACMEMQQVPAAAPRGERRQAILLAAERLFAQRGYHGVTIRQIAEQAGVPLALVGYYFGPKHELFHAIFEQWRHTVDERLALLMAPLLLFLGLVAFPFRFRSRILRLLGSLLLFLFPR